MADEARLETGGAVEVLLDRLLVVVVGARLVLDVLRLLLDDVAAARVESLPELGAQRTSSQNALGRIAQLGEITPPARVGERGGGVRCGGTAAAGGTEVAASGV